MKEIINKYRSGTLTLEEFLNNGFNFEIGDKWGEVGLIISVDKSDLDGKLQHGDEGRVVIKSAQLDALSALPEATVRAMEKQPEYEYVRVARNDVDSGMIDGVFIDDVGEVSVRDASVAEFLCCDLYRRVEITPEQKREREVEELAQVIYQSDHPHEEVGPIPECEKDCYIYNARVAIEWMESKK